MNYDDWVDQVIAELRRKAYEQSIEYDEFGDVHREAMRRADRVNSQYKDNEPTRYRRRRNYPRRPPVSYTPDYYDEYNWQNNPRRRGPQW